MDRSSFRTPDESAVTAVTADEMRSVDRVAVEDVGLQLLQMMENAGRTLAWHVRDLPEADDGPVVVVAGNGGNGGGGLACARHLANRGWPVRILILLDRPAGELTGASARQHRILDKMGVPVTTELGHFPREEGQTAVVDALIGYGLDGPVRDQTREYVEWINRQSGPTVSLDVPSGVDATTGETLGIAATPSRTVTLALPKTGLVAVPGTIVLADIGIPGTVYDRLGIEYDNPCGDSEWVELVG